MKEMVVYGNCEEFRINLTNRCSCPLKCCVEQRMKPGNSIQRCVDVAGQLNSMLDGFSLTCLCPSGRLKGDSGGLALAFMLYQRSESSTHVRYTSLNQSFTLAGYNLVHQLWEQFGKPINHGWSMNRLELAAACGAPSGVELAFLIDFDPGSESRIGIIEIEKIHAFTYGNRKSKMAYWTPLMLEFATVMEDEDCDHLTPSLKRRLIRSFRVRKQDVVSSVEFLYLNGTDLSWNWGKNGMTNAAFIGPDARTYFRKYF